MKIKSSKKNKIDIKKYSRQDSEQFQMKLKAFCLIHITYFFTKKKESKLNGLSMSN